jgi:hypothetical protein
LCSSIGQLPIQLSWRLGLGGPDPEDATLRAFERTEKSRGRDTTFRTSS